MGDYDESRVINNHVRNNYTRVIDTGLDLTPVRDLKTKNSDLNEIKSFQDRVNNLNIRPIEYNNIMSVSNLPVNKILSNAIDNNPSSESETSCQVKCCINTLKWGSSKSCCKNNKLVLKTKQNFANQRQVNTYNPGHENFKIKRVSECVLSFFL